MAILAARNKNGITNAQSRTYPESVPLAMALSAATVAVKLYCWRNDIGIKPVRVSRRPVPPGCTQTRKSLPAPYPLKWWCGDCTIFAIPLYWRTNPRVGSETPCEKSPQGIQTQAALKSFDRSLAPGDQTEPGAGRFPHRRHGRLGGRAGGLRAVLLPPAPGHRPGVRPGAAPGADPQRHDAGTAWAAHQDEGRRGGRRDGGSAQPRLRDSSQCGPGHPARKAPGAGTGRAAGPADADRLLLPAVGGGPEGKGHRHYSLGHGQRRHAGPESHQGKLRDGHGARPGLGQV